MTKISTEFQSLISGPIDPYSNARLSDFTAEKKIAKKEEPKVEKDRFIGPEDSDEQLKLEYRSLIGS